MSSNAATQIKNMIIDENVEETFDVGDMLFDGVVGLATGIWGGNGASYGNTAGIKSAGKQLFKRGFFDQHARTYYFKVAHNSDGKYVLFELMKSLRKSSVGSGIITIKSWGATLWD